MNMKKLTCIFLSLSMIFAVSAQGFAYSEKPAEEHPQTIAVKSNGHGEYTLASDVQGRSGVSTLSGEDITVAYATKDKEIYHVSGDTYLAEVKDSTYLMVKSVPLNVNDIEANADAFQTYQIDDELQGEIAATIESQKAIGNDDFEIELFAPASTQGTTNPPAEYYKHNGNNMKDTFVKYSHLSVSSETISGTSTLTYAKALKSLALSIGGIKVAAVGLFGVADSAYDFYKATYGAVSRGSAGDKTYTNISYDKLVKKTYYGLGSSYLHGCTSQKLWIDKNFTYQYYSATGKSDNREVFVNQTRYSPSFNSAADVALRSADTPHNDGVFKATIHGTTYVF